MLAAVTAACVGVFLTTLGHCVATTPRMQGRVALESLWSLEQCSASLRMAGALNLADVWVRGNWGGVLTAGWVHGSWLHLILNIWSLWVVGVWAEATWGHVRTGLLWLLGSVAGCLASLAWAEAPMVVGASAGIMALAGALWVARLLGRGAVLEHLRPVSARSLGTALLLLLVLGFAVPVIAQAGHVGGLAVGVVVGWAWAVPGARVRGWIAAAVVGVLGGALAGAGRAPTWRPAYHELCGHALLEEGEPEAALAAFERALAESPEDPILANAVAYALAEAGLELDRALDLVQRALAAEPTNADYLDTLGWVECKRGNTEVGLGALERARVHADRFIPEIDQHVATCAKAGEPR